MGLFTNELIDIVEWLDPSSDTLVYRFPRFQNEIKNGAKLTVRESQAAVFENEGKVADIFKPGLYGLTTQNMPVLTTLMGWKYGFNSPFKAEVYFVNTRVFTDQKWGTPSPVMLRDAEFGGAVRIRAFGSYTFNVSDPGKLVTQIVGTSGLFTTDDITSQLRDIIITRFSDALAESNIPVLDMSRNYDAVSKLIQNKIAPEFEEYGLTLNKFLISNITLPQEVEKMLDTRTSMGLIGDMNRYTQFQTAQAIEDAANNPNGAGSQGMGLGVGFGMANQMVQQFNRQGAPAGGAVAPPPLPGTANYFIAINGQQQGPYDVSGLKQLAGANQFTRDTLVWKQSMSQWTSAGLVPELQELFNGSTPPPLPTAA